MRRRNVCGVLEIKYSSKEKNLSIRRYNLDLELNPYHSLWREQIFSLVLAL